MVSASPDIPWIVQGCFRSNRWSFQRAKKITLEKYGAKVPGIQIGQIETSKESQHKIVTLTKSKTFLNPLLDWKFQEIFRISSDEMPVEIEIANPRLKRCIHSSLYSTLL